MTGLYWFVQLFRRGLSPEPYFKVNIIMIPQPCQILIHIAHPLNLPFLHINSIFLRTHDKLFIPYFQNLQSFSYRLRI